MPVSSPTASSSVTDTLSPGQGRFLYWFSGLFPILTCIVTPLTVYHRVLKKPGVSDIQRYNDLVQEVSRQLISGTIGLVTYFGGGEMARGLMEKLWRGKAQALDESSKHTGMIVGGAFMSFLGFAFLRPALSVDMVHLFRKEALPNGAVAPIPPSRALSGWQKKAIHWVDGHLMRNGLPQLRKAAAFSTLMLGAYLGALAFAIHGLSQLFGYRAASKAPPSQAPVQSPLLPPPTISGRPASQRNGPSSLNAFGRALPGAWSGNEARNRMALQQVQAFSTLPRPGGL